jgi:hypothetical protein
VQYSSDFRERDESKKVDWVSPFGRGEIREFHVINMEIATGDRDVKLSISSLSTLGLIDGDAEGDQFNVLSTILTLSNKNAVEDEF